ncbi:Group XV phospholipase A2 [Nymphon striatum]|nr:Group XV phospholipase A2 [Nymphon striatum]
MNEEEVFTKKVPGDGGNQIEAKLNRQKVCHPWCTKKSSYYRLWLNLELMMPYLVECTIDNLRLEYNNKSRKTQNKQGVYTRVPGFGDTYSVEWLDSSSTKEVDYFATMVNYLVRRGLKRGVSIRGAPLDFRKAPNEHQGYFGRLRKLIESTYGLNHNNRVVLICHSMGCPLTVTFLQTISQHWKDKFIKSFITLSAPFGGTVKSLRAIISGINLGSITIRRLTIRKYMRSSPSVAYLLPLQRLWNSSEIVVQTPTKNYTVNDYKMLFDDIDHPDSYELWKDTRLFLKRQTPPGVETYCFHGSGIQTEEKLTYSDFFPDINPVIEYGDGDGTVNKRSLERCKEWSILQKEQLIHKIFNQTTHADMMKDKNVLKLVYEIIQMS